MRTRVFNGLTTCSFRNREREPAFATLERALEVLIGPEYSSLPSGDRILTNILRYTNQVVAVEQSLSEIALEHKFAVLESCELILRSPQSPESARKIVRKLRVDLGHVWLQEYMVWVEKYWCVL